MENDDSMAQIRSLLGIASPIQKVLDSIKNKNGVIFNVSGGSNSGKSKFTQMITEALSKDGKKCAYFDIENSGWYSLFSRNNKNLYKSSLPKVDIFFPANEIHFLEQINECIKLQYDCIVIDYVNLLHSNNVESINEIPIFLKKIAKENNIFIVAAINSRKASNSFFNNCQENSDYFAVITKDSNHDLCLSFLKSILPIQNEVSIIPTKN